MVRTQFKHETTWAVVCLKYDGSPHARWGQFSSRENAVVFLRSERRRVRGDDHLRGRLKLVKITRKDAGT